MLAKKLTSALIITGSRTGVSGIGYQLQQILPSHHWSKNVP
jgi:hypothetical protein